MTDWWIFLPVLSLMGSGMATGSSVYWYTNIHLLKGRSLSNYVANVIIWPKEVMTGGFWKARYFNEGSATSSQWCWGDCGMQIQLHRSKTFTKIPLQLLKVVRENSGVAFLTLDFINWEKCMYYISLWGWDVQIQLQICRPNPGSMLLGLGCLHKSELTNYCVWAFTMNKSQSKRS